MSLREELQAAEDHAAHLRRRIAAEGCRTVGCTMESYGGANAGCGPGCGCSVPVNVCTKCGDSDYGDNAEAAAIRANCAQQRQ